jgi:hypothetical protein
MRIEEQSKPESQEAVMENKFSHDEDTMSIMLRHGFLGIPETPAVIARELRRMATGTDPYENLSGATPSEKFIWIAAADFLEQRP